jgi:toxin CcdB
MAQFDVYANPNPPSRKTRPYIVVLQSDYTAQTETVVVAPLAVKEAFGGGAQKLHPIVTVAGRELIVATHEVGAILRRNLGKVHGNVAAQRYEIISAIDVLFTGF